MEKLHILDCTLRDGGYVNDWDFGQKNIQEIMANLSEAKIEIIECGFLSEVKESRKGRSVFSAISQAEEYCDNRNSSDMALMINCGEYDPEHFPEYRGGKISVIRIAFHKHQRGEAQKLCLALKNKGYKVFFQPMYTLGYKDGELLDLIDWANKNAPEAFYIVDSFGTMRNRDALRIFYLVDNNLDPTIKIGFHSHNNLQLSFSNAQEIIKVQPKRDLIIDTSVLGMGRGAGNLCTELMTQYINENIEKKYNLLPLLETMDENITPIYSKHPWGYSAPYYIAAINGCHPNYATYLINRQTLFIKEINGIIKNIPESKKHLFDKELINDLYLQFQSHNIDDSAAISGISELCRGRKALILAPGKSLLTYRAEIERYISDNNPVVFGINHIPKFHKYDRIFISNLKRFKSIDNAIEIIKDKLICTSNISVDKNVCVVNYSSYLNGDDAIYDNSGLMLINILIKAGVCGFALAGYDGFDYVGAKNYFDENLVNNINAQKQCKINSAVISYFEKIEKSVNIKFITPTLYDKGMKNERI